MPPHCQASHRQMEQQNKICQKAKPQLKGLVLCTEQQILTASQRKKHLLCLLIRDVARSKIQSHSFSLISKWV